MVPPGVGNSEAFPSRNFSLLPPPTPCHCGPEFLVLCSPGTGSGMLRHRKGRKAHLSPGAGGGRWGVTVNYAPYVRTHSFTTAHLTDARSRLRLCWSVVMGHSCLGQSWGGIQRLWVSSLRTPPTTQEAVSPAEGDPCLNSGVPHLTGWQTVPFMGHLRPLGSACGP